MSIFLNTKLLTGNQVNKSFKNLQLLILIIFTSLPILASSQESAGLSNQKSPHETYEILKSMSKLPNSDWTSTYMKIKKGAEEGYPRSQYILGRMYYDGLYFDKDKKTAIEWFKKSAEQGEAESQLIFGMLTNEPKEKIFWKTEAANQGHRTAQISLGLLYSTGSHGIIKNDQTAYFWLLLAAVGGNKQASDLRDYVGESLSNQQRIDVQNKAANWKPISNHPIKYSDDMVSPRVESKKQTSDITGTGFRVARNAFVTNNHVVQDCSKILVNGAPAKIRSSDSKNDLALAQVALPGPIAAIRSQRVSVGEPLAIAGYPLRGLLSGFNMTTGNLSSLSGIGGDTRLSQITAPVQPGNSGGPVLDYSGNIMGVVVSKLDALQTAKITGDIPQNVNFSINLGVLRSFLDASSVEYDVVPSDKTLPTTVIADKAKGFTVLFECWK
ncbi:trypsin-like peptidase domain-containing protein [Malikia spinosa]|uniref:trypsin-like peptidase domain-containing protein n=1 Tax=Malikia spinosa TaxID=86180 RepID=UPI003FA29137